jgi:hypothetical protein
VRSTTLGADALRRHADCSNGADSPCVAHRCGQLSTRHVAHPSAHDRILDAKQLRELGVEVVHSAASSSW